MKFVGKAQKFVGKAQKFVDKAQKFVGKAQKFVGCDFGVETRHKITQKSQNGRAHEFFCLAGSDSRIRGQGTIFGV